MCFDGGALARAQYTRANFIISPELFIFFGARSFIADKGVVLVYYRTDLTLARIDVLQASNTWGEVRLEPPLPFGSSLS